MRAARSRFTSPARETRPGRSAGARSFDSKTAKRCGAGGATAARLLRAAEPVRSSAAADVGGGVTVLRSGASIVPRARLRVIRPFAELVRRMACARRACAHDAAMSQMRPQAYGFSRTGAGSVRPGLPRVEEGTMATIAAPAIATARPARGLLWIATVSTVGAIAAVLTGAGVGLGRRRGGRRVVALPRLRWSARTSPSARTRGGGGPAAGSGSSSPRLGLGFAVASLNVSSDSLAHTIGRVALAAVVVYVAYAFLCFPRDRLETRCERRLITAFALASAALWLVTLPLVETLAGVGADRGLRRRLPRQRVPARRDPRRRLLGAGLRRERRHRARAARRDRAARRQGPLAGDPAAPPRPARPRLGDRARGGVLGVHGAPATRRRGAHRAEGRRCRRRAGDPARDARRPGARARVRRHEPRLARRPRRRRARHRRARRRPAARRPR